MTDPQYYWVQLHSGEWEIAELLPEGWFLCGDERAVVESQIAVVGERIVRKSRTPQTPPAQ